MPSMDVEVSRYEAPVLAPVAHEALAGPTRSGLFSFIGMSIGVVVAPVVLATSQWALTMMHLPPLGFGPIDPASVFFIAFSVVGSQAGRDIAAIRHYRAYQAALTRRGSPSRTAMRFSLEDDALVFESVRMTHRVAWDAIVELLATPTHWLVQADSLTLILPRRGFADSSAERAFLSDLLARLSPTSREQSAAAVAYAAGGPEPRHSALARRVAALAERGYGGGAAA